MRATRFNPELLLMQCVCAFDWANLLPSFSATAVSFLIILWHTRSLPLCLPPSIRAFLSPSLPLSLAGLYLLAGLRGNYHSSEMLSYCTATLCSALPLSTQTAHTYEHTQIRTHILWTCAHTQACMHTKTPHIQRENELPLPHPSRCPE